jgi:hypothetical protein
MRSSAAFGILLIVVSSQAWAAEVTDSPLRSMVSEVYQFDPGKLDDEARKDKSKAMDKFWSHVKGLGAEGLTQLRQELERPGHPQFFYYDGAKLLLSSSKTPDDRKLALAAIERGNVSHIDFGDFFFTVHRFAVHGYDTSGAAFKILSEPRFSVFVANHAMRLGPDYCLLYMLLPTEERFYVDKAAQRLLQETDITAQRSLILLLALTVTKTGDEALERFSQDAGKPEESRRYAAALLKEAKETEAAATGGKADEFGALKARRRDMTRRVSDEALAEIHAVTSAIRRERPKEAL